MAIYLRGAGLGEVNPFDPSTWFGTDSGAPQTGGTSPVTPASDFSGDVNSLPLCPAGVGGNPTTADIAAGRVGAQNGWCRAYVGAPAMRYSDPWDPSASGTTFRVTTSNPSGASGGGVFDWLFGSGGAGVIVGATTPTPGTQVHTTTPIVVPTPWYKTPLGIIGIALVGFIGYKAYASQSATKPAAGA